MNDCVVGRQERGRMGECGWMSGTGFHWDVLGQGAGRVMQKFWFWDRRLWRRGISGGFLAAYRRRGKHFHGVAFLTMNVGT